MTRDDRLLSLDAVRGVALLGILLLNIVHFAMPLAAYFNPRAYGGSDGADLAVYLFNFVLFDGKMRGLFSVLFGASMLLVIERAEAGGRSPAKTHYSRMIWLLLFGLAHLFFIWDGDILAHYALIGMIAYLCRKLPVSKLMALGLVLVLAETVICAGAAYALGAALATPPGSAEAARTIAEFRQGFGIPTSAEIAKELAVHRGGYAGLVAWRLEKHVWSPLLGLAQFGPETLGYMLFGMAGLRSGMLRGEWPRARYWRWMLVGFGIGIPAYIAIVGFRLWRGFDLFGTLLGVLPLTVPVRPLMILGWACLILLLLRPGGALTTRLAAVGRMAFTNYLATSLICTTLFYGYGFGWYGHLGRAELYLVVLGVWALLLLWSKPWLTRFRYGPFEWLWRSLARGKPQSIFVANGTQ